MKKMNNRSKGKRCRKEFLRYIYVVIVIGALLVAGSVQATAASHKARIVTWGVGLGDAAFHRQLVEDYNTSHPDVELVFDPALEGLEATTQATQKLRIALENQAGPDVVGGVDSGAALEAVVASGEVMDLTAAYEQYGWTEKVPQVFIERVTVDGKIYALPANIETVGLFYNKDLFDELGLSIPKTYDEYLTILQTIKEAGYYGFALGLAGGWPSAFMASAFCYGSAGSEYRAVLSGEIPWTESERVLAGLEAFHHLVESGYTNPEVLGIDQDAAHDLFFQGQTAMTLMGPWFITDAKEAELDFEVGFFYMPPTDPNSDIRSFGGEGGTILISSHTEHPDAALEFVDWLFSPETAQTILRGSSNILLTPFEVPDDIDPLLKQVTEETLANIDQVGFWPVTHLAPALFRQMNQFVQGMMGGQLTPSQVLEKMQDAHETYKREKGNS